jgi:predicted phage baseplate assembly protein
MPLPAPTLDDRTFEDLVNEARRRIPLYTPEWTDHNLSDPGITLIELFSYLIDIMLYRMNRMPERHYIKFMELIGMMLREPEPARTEITFWLTKPQDYEITIPLGTEVSTTRTETEPAITFSTAEAFTIHVPKLRAVLSRRMAERKNADDYAEPDMKRLALGSENFRAFSTAPAVGDAFYVGFEQDMSRHIIGLDMELDTAAGAGVDPTQPPYVWEVLSKVEPTEWTPAELDVDKTKALNMNGVLSLHLPHMVQGRIDGKDAYWLRCRLIEVPPNIPKYRNSPVVRKLELGSWGCTMNATHSGLVIDELLGRSDGSPGQRFNISNTPVLSRIDGERILVRIDNKTAELWTEVEDFGDSGPDDKHYAIDNNTGELRFGPALPQRDGSVKRYGAIPPRGAMIVMTRYRYGGGVAGNVQARQLNVLKSSIPYVDRVANRKLATGGLNSEDIEDAKQRVPGHIRTIDRAVTARDYEYLAVKAAPGFIQRIHCLQPPSVNTGQVQVLVVPRVQDLSGYIPPEELALPDSIRETIKAYLDERRMISTRLEVSQPAYFFVTTRVRVRISQYYKADGVKLAAEMRLYEYLNPVIGGADHKGWPFGRSLYVADVIAALQGLPGLEVIHSVELFPVTFDAAGKAITAEPVTEVKLVTHGVIASYRHDIREESE